MTVADTIAEDPATEPGAPAHHDQPLARNRDFRVLLSSQGVSALGDAVSFTALPLLVLALTGSGLAMGVVGALQTLPDLVFGMVAGALADRHDRKRMMFLADLGRAVLTAAIPISVFLGGPTMVVILIVAAPLSTLRALFLAAYTASVPALVGRSQVARANSYFEAVYSIGYIVGPAIAGVLSSTIGPGPTLAIDAVSFGLSGLALAAVRRDLRAPVDRPRASLLTDIREGIDFIVAHPMLRAMIAFWGIVSITTAPLVTALAVYVTRDLGHEDAILGLILTAYGLGTVAGALLTSRASPRSVAPILLGGTFATGLLPRDRGAHRSGPDPPGRRGRVRRRAVDGAGDLRDGADRVLPGRAARPHRQHGPHDLAGAAADRAARRRRAHRPHQRRDDDRGDGYRPRGPQPGLHPGPRPADRAAPAADGDLGRRPRARRTDRRRLSALTPQPSHVTRVSPSSVVASPAQSGQSIVIISLDSLLAGLGS